MAHFAQIDSDSIVTQVIVVGNEDAPNDVFYHQQPYPSWSLNTSTWDWDAPVAVPSDAGVDDADNPTEYVSYTWNEGSTSWTNRTVLDLT